jgi:DNA processing protein
MACPQCRRRAALIVALAPAISRLRFSRKGLLTMLALPDARLLRAAKVTDSCELMRGLQLSLPTESVPTALCRHDPDYPAALAQLACAPAVLYATCEIGRLRELVSKPTVAIVGSRTPSAYARQVSSELARDLAAAGITLVSGMNSGLEGLVHRGALQANGHTIAVMPAGPEIPYPREHAVLHEGILAHGVALSEFPPRYCPPEPWSFIAGQRVIAALASLVVVVEVGGHSCALLTAEIGSDLGADVAVVPGRLTDPGGSWLFALLKDGAHPVACAQDVLDLIDGVDVRAVAA